MHPSHITGPMLEKEFSICSLLTKWSFGEVQAGQVVSFGAVLLVAEHQLPSVSTAKTLVFGLLLSLTFPPPVLPLKALSLWLRVAV